MAKRVYTPKNKPWDHQGKALRKMWMREYFALLMAMRTGKSYTLLTDYGKLEAVGEVSDFTLIAPAGVYKTWVDQIDEHVAPSLRERLTVKVWDSSAEGSKIAERRRETFLGKDGPRALLINAEALSTVETARRFLLRFLSQRPGVTGIDESTIMRDPDSNRTEFINEKVRPLSKYRRILSGLPSPNSPFDVFGQFYFLSPGILGDSFVNHKAHYAEINRICMLKNHLLVSKLERAVMREGRMDKTIMLDGVGRVEVGDLPRQVILNELERRKVYVQTIPVIKRFRNEEELHEKIAPHSYRVRLEDVYDVPPKVYMRREVELDKEQARIYRELRIRSMAELNEADFVTPSMVITRLLRMHQVLCGHVKDDSGKVHEIKEKRTAELLAILEEYDGQAIIWCRYDPDIRKLSRVLQEKYGAGCCAHFWGGNVKTREAEEKEFKAGKRRFNLATPSAGGRGRTWNMASLMVYYSNSDDLEHRLQSEERGEAVGKSVPMVVVDLVAPGTVDEKFVHALRRKLNMATVINGDNYKEWLI